MLKYSIMSKFSRDYGFDVCSYNREIPIETIENIIRQDLNPFGPCPGPRVSVKLIIPNDSSEWNSTVGVEEIAVVHDPDKFLMELDPPSVSNSIGAYHRINSTLPKTQGRFDEIKKILQASNMTPESFVEAINKKKLKAKDISPTFIMDQTDFDSRYDVSHKDGSGRVIVSKPSKRWNISLGGNNILMRREDEFMVLPQGKKVTIDEAIAVIQNSGDVVVGKLPDSSLTMTMTGALPGKAKLAPSMRVTMELIDSCIKRLGIKNTSSLKKHEKFEVLAEYIGQNSQELEIPEYFQMYQGRIDTNSVESLTPEDHLMILFKTVMPPNSSVGIGGRDFPVVPERVSMEGNYNESLIVELPRWNDALEDKVPMRTELSYGSTRNSEI